MKSLIITGLAVALLGGAASAQDFQVSTVNARQQKIDARIDQGVKQGTLTAAEAQKLKAEYRSIAQQEAAFRKSDGINDQERQKLMQRLAALNARIGAEKSDAQVNPNR